MASHGKQRVIYFSLSVIIWDKREPFGGDTTLSTRSKSDDWAAFCEFLAFDFSDTWHHWASEIYLLLEHFIHTWFVHKSDDSKATSLWRFQLARFSEMPSSLVPILTCEMRRSRRMLLGSCVSPVCDLTISLLRTTGTGTAGSASPGAGVRY